jgi:hypothetical protein
MNVNGPSDWGRVEGVVQSLGHCDSNPAPLKGAVVTVDGGLQLETDANGHYSTWLPSGSHELVVTADGHVAASATVQIVPQQITYQDFDLRSIEPCISVAPTFFDVTVPQGGFLSEELTIVNTGAGDSSFKIAEREAGLEKWVAPALVPDGKPVTPQGASSDAKVQPMKPRLDANPILVVSSTDVYESVEKALQELGYAYDYTYGPPWTGIDFSPYEYVIVAMDGGLAEVSDVQALRTGVLDAGKRLIILGGTCYQPWAQGLNQYIVLNDVNNYCWQVTGYPQFTVTDPTNPLADGLPSPYNYANSAAGYYQIRVTDPNIENAAVNGENWPTLFHLTTFPGQGAQQFGDLIWYIDSVYGYYWTDPNDYAFLKQVINNAINLTGADVPWLSENPTEGTVPAEDSFPVAVEFNAAGLAIGDYMANLIVTSQDAVNKRITVPVTMHVVPGGATMHIGDIQGQFSLDPYGRYLIKIRVLVHDQDHSPLGEVAVDASLWSPAGGPYERTRMTKNMTGKAAFPWGSRSAGMWKICVDNLTKSGYAYVPGDNDVPACAEWDNTP